MKYFETIHASDLKHSVVKRGLQESNHPFNKIKEVQFSALGRNFRLLLSPKRDILHSKFKAYSVDATGLEKSVHLDHDNFYGGRVFGEVDSDASLHIDDGVMTGTIRLPDETYHIEVRMFYSMTCIIHVTVVALLAPFTPSRQPNNDNIQIF